MTAEKTKGQKVKKERNQNPLRAVRLGKVTINIGCGGNDATIEKAKKLMEMITDGRKPVVTLSKRRSTFGIVKGKPVGVKLTLRGEQAAKLLKMALSAVDNKIKSTQFSEKGDFSFGVKEYIELPGVKYRHDIGMLGFDVDVTLQRAGYGISRRKIQNREIPRKHIITREEAVDWLSKNFGTTII